MFIQKTTIPNFLKDDFLTVQKLDQQAQRSMQKLVDRKENAENMEKENLGRIMGGREAPFDAYPKFARLVSCNGSLAGCGSMLVDPEIVLTAVYCVTQWLVSQAAVQISALSPNNNCALSQFCPNPSDNCGAPML